ncbi:hypothetical protein SRB5_25660 [Streptomyces sp. RB5]|uniref:Formate hydrogenlyase regulatory protein HycA n=1 Tax=Streptomyces smaragdinus TaxID=2585196 RepID=A0A7K0CHF3_9ACTN|nr:hypothetical protein [Streptomyces smaragdinus]MQY12432.1 hypothetical protein [Streptomyces smaragdinus]
MPIPAVIPIRYEPGYRTEHIGRYDEGQFFASVTAAYTDDFRPGADDWLRHRRWYAVLHRFDADGTHTGSDIWTPGPGVPADGRLDARLEQLLGSLPGLEFGDIAIRPFELRHDGIRFGLVPECHDEKAAEAGEPDWAELYPDRLGFSTPWNGEYST